MFHRARILFRSALRHVGAITEKAVALVEVRWMFLGAGKVSMLLLKECNILWGCARRVGPEDMLVPDGKGKGYSQHLELDLEFNLKPMQLTRAPVGYVLQDPCCDILGQLQFPSQSQR